MAVILTMSPGGWVAVVLALIGVLGTIATARAAYRKADAEFAAARAPVELAQVKADAAIRKDDSKRFETEHGLAAKLLEEERASKAVELAKAAEQIREARVETALVEERAAKEVAEARGAREHAEHQAALLHAQNEGLLARVDEAERDAAEHQECREQVRAQSKEIRELSVKVGECEARHEAQEAYSDRMFKLFEARLRALEPKNSVHPPLPERERSITPADMPAVSKEQKP
jgi:hypothetical protein